MALSREEAIREHRKMWNWIADRAEKEKVYAHKKEYLDLHGYCDIENDCFCCEYSYKHFDSCFFCPLCWLEEQEYYVENDIDRCYCVAQESPYNALLNCDDLETYGKLAREIANLKEA